MEKCDHFKDLILTDYIDGELEKNAAQGLESHLLDCSDCRAFFKELKDNVALPFQKAAQQPVPGELWRAIKQNIEQADQTASPLGEFIDRLKGLVVFPRVVPVFASLVLMLLAGSVTINTIQIQQAKDKDQGEYLVSLLSPTDASLQAENNDGATPIEHYFL